MSIFEYDEERELKLIRQAEYEEGLKVGRENGLKDGRVDGLKSHLRSQVVKAEKGENSGTDCRGIRKRKFRR